MEDIRSKVKILPCSNKHSKTAKSSFFSNASTRNDSISKQDTLVLKGSKYYHCHLEACSCSFNYLYQLRKHLSFVHKLNYYDCRRCGSRFIKYSSYRKHLTNICACESTATNSTEVSKIKSDEVLNNLALITIKDLVDKFEADKITCYNRSLINSICPGLTSFSSLMLN